MRTEPRRWQCRIISTPTQRRTGETKCALRLRPQRRTKPDGRGPPRIPRNGSRRGQVGRLSPRSPGQPSGGPGTGRVGHRHRRQPAESTRNGGCPSQRRESSRWVAEMLALFSKESDIWTGNYSTPQAKVSRSFERFVTTSIAVSGAFSMNSSTNMQPDMALLGSSCCDDHDTNG